MPESIRWRLLYETGLLAEEPLDGGSIVEAWNDADELLLVNTSGEPVMRIELLVKGARYRPIFYRVRQQSAKLQMAPASGGTLDLGGGVLSVTRGPTSLAAVVFGRGRTLEPEIDWESLTGQQQVDVQLWALIDGQVVDCPRKMFDLAQVRRQIEAELSEPKLIVS